nr:peptidyl-tRNA hydrolase, mitochondrial [Ipomoea batatas]
MLSRICRRSLCSAFPQPWLFIGLGNPGDKYKGTRHNVGFDMVDAFAESVGIQMEDVHCKAIFGKVRICVHVLIAVGKLQYPGFLNGVPVFLAKPQTYMNLSGESVDVALQEGVGALKQLLSKGLTESSREFEMMKMKEAETIMEYSNTLLGITNKIRLLDKDFRDNRIVQKILVNLPEKYESKDLSSIYPWQNWLDVAFTKNGVGALNSSYQRA